MHAGILLGCWINHLTAKLPNYIFVIWNLSDRPAVSMVTEVAKRIKYFWIYISFCSLVPEILQYSWIFFLIQHYFPDLLKDSCLFLTFFIFPVFRGTAFLLSRNNFLTVTICFFTALTLFFEWIFVHFWSTTLVVLLQECTSWCFNFNPVTIAIIIIIQHYYQHQIYIIVVIVDSFGFQYSKIQVTFLKCSYCISSFIFQ